MSGTCSVNKVTQQHHEMMTSLSAPAQEKPRAQISERKGRSSSWQVDRTGCRPPSNIGPRSVAKNYPGSHTCLCSVCLGRLALACSGQQNITNGFFFFHFLEERLPTARIKIECESCHRNPVRSKHTHIVQWPWGDRADKQNLRVFITLLELTLQKTSSQPLSPGWLCLYNAACQVNHAFGALQGHYYLGEPDAKRLHEESFC